MIKVQNEIGLIRDSVSGAILAENNPEFAAYLNQKAKILAQKKELEQQISQINNLTAEVNELKTLVQNLLERIGGKQ